MPPTPLQLPASPPDSLDCHVVTLTHFLPPYVASVLLHTAQHVRAFQVLLSIEREPNRQYCDTWKGLDVEVQRSLMFRRPWRHKTGFQDELYVHVPYDTIAQLHRAKPDIVFSYELGFRSLTSALYCKVYRKKLAICVCVSEHTEQGRGIIRYWLRQILLKAADAVTYNGPSCLRYLKRFDLPDEKLFYFPYATSDSFRYTGPVERTVKSDRRLLCIGQLTERKGVVPLVKSLIEYCQSRPDQVVEIDFIGTGNLGEKLFEQVLPPNLCIQSLGHVPYDEICKVMEQSGILIFPTLADEWGLVVNEALQAGMPVIGSEYAQACTSLIREGETGWLYQPDRPAQLWQKLDEMFATDREKLSQMRHAAQESVREITPQRVAASAIRMFQALLQSGRPTPDRI